MTAFVPLVADSFFVFLCAVIVVAMNYLPNRYYSWVFKGSMALMLLDFFLCIVWLPIGASKTYGFRTASEVFLQYHNGTGAPAGWNWMLVCE